MEGSLRTTLSILNNRGALGRVSLPPHLPKMGKYSGTALEELTSQIQDALMTTTKGYPQEDIPLMWSLTVGVWTYYYEKVVPISGP